MVFLHARHVTCGGAVVVAGGSWHRRGVPPPRGEMAGAGPGRPTDRRVGIPPRNSPKFRRDCSGTHTLYAKGTRVLKVWVPPRGVATRLIGAGPLSSQYASPPRRFAPVTAVIVACPSRKRRRPPRSERRLRRPFEKAALRDGGLLGCDAATPRRFASATPPRDVRLRLTACPTNSGSAIRIGKSIPSHGRF